jgi:hypothetical protein
MGNKGCVREKIIDERVNLRRKRRENNIENRKIRVCEKVRKGDR